MNANQREYAAARLLEWGGENFLQVGIRLRRIWICGQAGDDFRNSLATRAIVSRHKFFEVLACVVIGAITDNPPAMHGHLMIRADGQQTKQIHVHGICAGGFVELRSVTIRCHKDFARGDFECR